MNDGLEDGELPVDNYNVVNMEIDSSEEGNTNDADDEAEKLREILIKQMQKKRSNKPKTQVKSTNLLTSIPLTSTSLPSNPRDKMMSPPSFRPPSFHPPLSPPIFSSQFYSLPPPPIPPQMSYNNPGSLADTEEYTHNMYEPLLCTSTANLEMADTPRSPDEAILDVLQFVDSSDESSGEPVYEFDVDNAKKDSKGRKREIDRLFKKQKANETEYKTLKSSIEQAKKELNEMEKKLLHHAEKGMELNTRIQSHFDRYFVSDSERLEQISVERTKWKSKFTQRSAKSKERIKNLKDSAALVMSQPYSRPKIIPLNPISTPPLRYSFPQVDSIDSIDKTPKISDYVAAKRKSEVTSTSTPDKQDKGSSSKPTKPRINYKTDPKEDLKEDPKEDQKSDLKDGSKGENKRSRRKESRKSSKSADKRLEKVADQLNIAQIVGDKKRDANEVEAELLTRILEREKKKQHSKDKSEKRKRSKRHNENESITETEKDSEYVEDPIQDPVHYQQPGSSHYASLDNNFPTSSRFISLQSAAGNPLIGIKAYRTSPSFPFEHIDHPAISNNLNPAISLCPFELHGICADSECQFQHDRDYRLSDSDIIRDILTFWPSLCPPGLTPIELAKKLLADNSVDYVARMLSSAIPSNIRDQCFSKELKDMISTSIEKATD